MTYFTLLTKPVSQLGGKEGSRVMITFEDIYKIEIHMR